MAGGITAILDDLGRTAEGADRSTVDDVAGAFGRRGAAPFLILPALIGISPLGGIPGVPTFLAVLIALTAGQIAVGRSRPWIPDQMGRRGISSERLRGAVRRMRPVARRIDDWVRDRWSWAAGDMAQRVAMGAVLALCLMVPPLEFVPFAAILPLTAIFLFGVAMLVGDGLVMLTAFAATVGAVGGALWLALG